MAQHEERKISISTNGGSLPKKQSVISAHSSSTLAHRVAKGGFWIFFLRVVHQLSYIVRLVILARILAPHDFGLMGIAMLTMAILEKFSQTGFHHALIQKKENTQAYLDSAWTALVIRGCILFGIFYCIAPYVASFFNVPEAKVLIRVFGFSVLLGGSVNIGVVYFLKELDFKKEFIFNSIVTIVEFSFAVSLAFILRNVWALVFGFLAGSLARTAISYFIHPYRPRLSLDFDRIKELFSYGKWIMGSSMIIFLLLEGDDILVGKILGATALGFYQLAYKISSVPATEVSHMISNVTFPAYSKLQDERARLKQAYLKVLQLTFILALPIAGLIISLAPEFTPFFLGEKWIPIVQPVQALALYGVVRAVNVTTMEVFRGIGKPRVVTLGSAVQLAMFALLVYPLTIKWEVMGTCVAIILPSLFMMVFLLKMLSRELEYKFVQFGCIFGIPSAGTLVMCVSISLLKNWIQNGLPGLILSLLLGIGIGFVFSFFLNKSFYFNLFRNIRELLLALPEKRREKFEKIFLSSVG